LAAAEDHRAQGLRLRCLAVAKTQRVGATGGHFAISVFWGLQLVEELVRAFEVSVCSGRFFPEYRPIRHLHHLQLRTFNGGCTHQRWSRRLCSYGIASLEPRDRFGGGSWARVVPMVVKHCGRKSVSPQSLARPCYFRCCRIEVARTTPGMKSETDVAG
jgi:hypothetical protein